MVFARAFIGRCGLSGFIEAVLSGNGCPMSLREGRLDTFDVGGHGEPPAPHGLDPFVPIEESPSPSSSCTDKRFFLPPDGVVRSDEREGNVNPAGSSALRELYETGRLSPPSALLRSADAC